jgi:hypothetical protein
MIHSKQSVQKVVAEYYGLAKQEVPTDENAKAICTALTLKYCRIPLGSEQEQDAAVEAVLNNPFLKRDIQTIEEMYLT